METLIHKSDGSLVSNDPFLTPGTRVKLRLAGTRSRYKSGVITEESARRTRKEFGENNTFVYVSFDDYSGGPLEDARVNLMVDDGNTDT